MRRGVTGLRRFTTLQELYKGVAGSRRWAKGTLFTLMGGWKYGYYTDAAVKCCLNGGLVAVYQDPMKRKAAEARLYPAIHKVTRGSRSTIIGFNDDCSTTIADIRKVCKLAKV